MTAKDGAALAGTTVCVARQPIFNAQLEVTAYELLYRAEAQDSRAYVVDGAIATSRVVVGSVAEIGLEKLSGGCVVHLNLPRELIVDPIELPLRPETTVLEVLETVRSDEAVLAGINAFRQRHFRIAVDDYVSASHDESLVQAADIVKIDLSLEPIDRLDQTVAALARRKLQIIAEKVETRQQFEHCRALGIRGFQGYWFQRPETFVARQARSDQLAPMQVLSALQDPDRTVETLERLVQQDLSLVYRLSCGSSTPATTTCREKLARSIRRSACWEWTTCGACAPSWQWPRLTIGRRNC